MLRIVTVFADVFVVFVRSVVVVSVDISVFVVILATLDFVIVLNDAVFDVAICKSLF